MITVLVVDDHAELNETLCKVIRAEGHRPISVRSGEAALTFLAADLPDLVFLDVAMPGLSGIEVLRAVRANPVSADLPVVMYSANADAALRQYALGQGATDYWVKGENDPALISALLKKLVRARRPA